MRIGVLVFHRVGDLDAVGPLAVLQTAAALAGDALELEAFTVARSRASIQTDADLTLTPAWPFAAVPELDGLVVPGGAGVAQALRDDATTGFVARVAARDDVHLFGISSGTLLLGAAGIVRGHRVATHPEVVEHARDYAALDVDGDGPVRDGRLWTAPTAGAGVALLRSFVRERIDGDLAARVDERLGLARATDVPTGDHDR